MKAFLDSNIFLNPLLAESECHDCLRVLDGWRKSGRIDEAVTSYLSMANIAYVLRKKAGKEKVAPTVQNLLNYISCISFLSCLKSLGLITDLPSAITLCRFY